MFHTDPRHKILIVDDNEVVLEATRAALASAGHEVLTHDRGAGCVALILQEKPDLVLMDVNMPRLSGDTLVSVIGKAQPAGETILLLYSSLSTDILRVKAQAAGAHGFVQKTSDLFALVREVNRWLKRSGTSSGRIRAAADVGVALSSGRLRAAAKVHVPGAGNPRAPSEFGASSSSQLRVGPDLGLPPRGEQPSGVEGPLASDDDTRSSGTVAVARQVQEERELSSRISGTPPEPPTVLLVDRDMSVLAMYRAFLQSDRLSVEYALSGSAALRRLLSATPPDVAVCDAFMPDVSGIDLYRRALGVEPNWQKRMVLTADVQLPTSGGAFAEFKGRLLTKPVSADAFISAVRACLESTVVLQSGRAVAT